MSKVDVDTLHSGENIFKNIWIQPAAGALGAALYYYYNKSGEKREVDGVKDKQKGSYLGPKYSEEEIKKFLDENNYPYKVYNKPEIYDKIAEFIDNGKVIGLFEGRMEYGPRALGARSIIGDARSKEMQSKLNLKIKYRESFRPFAPSVLEEAASKYFDIDTNSPYMLLCADVKSERRKNFNLEESKKESKDNLLKVVNKPRSDIPTITHVDYSARLQTVNKDANPFYYNVDKKLLRTIVLTSAKARAKYECELDSDMYTEAELHKNDIPAFIYVF